MGRTLLALMLAFFSSLSFAQDGAEIGAHLPSQVAADLIRQSAGSDGAFLAAGLVKEAYRADDLSSLLQFPGDQIVVVNLTGSELKKAFERAVSTYPQPNVSFLQVSGFEIVFSKSAPAQQRVQSVTVNGSKLDDKRSYSVAMPASLGRGGLGYFKIWDSAKIVKTLDQTVESVLKGKSFSATSPRWSVLD